jgi:hypothetical protein
VMELAVAMAVLRNSSDAGHESQKADLHVERHGASCMVVYGAWRVADKWTGR